MGILRRGGIHTLRVTIPPYLQQAIPAIYLGMPPLPLSTHKPLIGKGSDEHVANYSGISVGSFAPSSSTKGTKGIEGSGARINYGSDQQTGAIKRRNHTNSTTRSIKRTRDNSTQTSQKVKKKKAPRGKINGRDSKGRFKK